MEHISKVELYSQFKDFLCDELERERVTLNRRLFGVLIWCLVVPFLVLVAAVLLMVFGVVSSKHRAIVDFLIVFFPFAYATYFLTSELLMQLPEMLRKGGLVTTMEHSLAETRWRDNVCQTMKRKWSAKKGDWKWVGDNMEMDLKSISYRSRYLTTLVGVVFFVILQVLNSTRGAEVENSEIGPLEILGMVQNITSDFSLMLSLILFLIIFYLAGFQLRQNLERYLNCIRLIQDGS